MSPMGDRVPIVLENVTVAVLLHFIIDHHESPSTLIICSTRDAFLNEQMGTLMQESQHEWTTDPAVTADDDQSVSPERQSTTVKPMHGLLTPTLRHLSATRSINLAFCPDVPHLLCYLSHLASRSACTSDAAPSTPDAALKTSDSKLPILAILNPILLHRPTSSFSAQGLNKAFAAAAETAHVLRRKLVFAECSVSSPRHHSAENDGQEAEAMELTTEYENRDDQTQASSPWDEEVSILNVTTKSFGAGERGWVGRTVKLRRIAERWCRFDDY